MEFYKEERAKYGATKDSIGGQWHDLDVERAKGSGTAGNMDRMLAWSIYKRTNKASSSALSRWTSPVTTNERKEEITGPTVANCLACTVEIVCKETWRCEYYWLSIHHTCWGAMAGSQVCPPTAFRGRALAASLVI